MSAFVEGWRRLAPRCRRFWHPPSGLECGAGLLAKRALARDGGPVLALELPDVYDDGEALVRRELDRAQRLYGGEAGEGGGEPDGERGAACANLDAAFAGRLEAELPAGTLIMDCGDHHAFMHGGELLRLRCEDCVLWLERPWIGGVERERISRLQRLAMQVNGDVRLANFLVLESRCTLCVRLPLAGLAGDAERSLVRAIQMGLAALASLERSLPPLRELCDPALAPLLDLCARH